MTTRSQAVVRIRIADCTALPHSAFGVTWCHRSRDHLIATCHFLLVVLWNQASMSNGFQDIQRRM